jgi:outer membrane protein TolC
MVRFRTVLAAMCGLAISADRHAEAQTDAAAAAWAPGTSVATALGSSSQQPEEGELAAGRGDDGLIPKGRLLWHLPDPEIHRPGALETLERARQEGNKALVTNITRVIDQVEVIRRPEQLSLTLEDALRRALENSYAIKIASYNPAVETTRVVEAEAAFDAVFFTDMIKNVQDRPTGSELTSSDVDFFSLTGGVRKLLPIGTQVSASYGMQRTKTSIQFQQINPEYFNDIVLEMRQPFLRGFGLDQNRSLIIIAKNNRRTSDLAFRRQVRDTLRRVEEGYWNVVRARRDVVLVARMLAGFEAIYTYLDARRDFDVIPVQLAATKADLERSRAEFVRVCANVFDAEDALITAMNAPDIDLADDIEIVPTDSLTLERITVDRLAEVQTALDNRPEIKEDELLVANAKIAVGRAKNAELPGLDVTFRYAIDGLAGTADKAFDEVSRHNFTEYYVGVEFEVPIGNRGPRAAHHRAKLQHRQALAALKARFEEVILDVNLSVRRLASTYDELGPFYESVDASEREVNSIVARAERMDINTLRNELNARQNLAARRRGLLDTMVNYNIAIIDLERAKGTLLRHYNVVIASEGE